MVEYVLVGAALLCVVECADCLVDMVRYASWSYRRNGGLLVVLAVRLYVLPHHFEEGE